MLSDEIKAFDVMVGLLDNEARIKMLNDSGVCSLINAFVTYQANKK